MRGRLLAVWLLVIIVVAPLGAAPWPRVPVARAASEVYFPETGMTLTEPFLHYWQEHEGLSLLGYPISPVMRVASSQDGHELAVQWFERARLEAHPQNQPPYDVLLTRLGALAVGDRQFNAVPPFADTAERRYFAETGQALGGTFKTYWDRHGGLAQFGLPLSGELVEASPLNGQPYLTQWFERARFEYHPEEAGTAYEVQLGHLGRRAYGIAQQATTNFVRVAGKHFVVGLDGQQLTLKGVNYWPRDHPWRMWPEWDPAAVGHELDIARELGTNTVRIFIRFDDFGGASANWQQQQPYVEFLALCRTRGIRALVTLFDEHRKWPRTGWDNWPAAGTTDEAADLAYLRAVITPHRDDPTILGYDLYNEADWVSPGEWLWREHAVQRIDWLGRMAAQVRALDPHHLITVGTTFPEAQARVGAEGVAGGRALTDFIDVICIHYYRRNFHGTDAAALLAQLAPLGKPVLIEEGGHEGDGTPGHTEADQDDYMREVTTAVGSQGSAGLLVWMLNDIAGLGVDGKYGLLRLDYSLKPSALTFRDWTPGR